MVYSCSPQIPLENSAMAKRKDPLAAFNRMSADVRSSLPPVQSTPSLAAYFSRAQEATGGQAGYGTALGREVNRGQHRMFGGDPSAMPVGAPGVAPVPRQMPAAGSTAKKYGGFARSGSISKMREELYRKYAGGGDVGNSLGPKHRAAIDRARAEAGDGATPDDIAIAAAGAMGPETRVNGWVAPREYANMDPARVQEIAQNRLDGGVSLNMAEKQSLGGVLEPSARSRGERLVKSEDARRTRGMEKGVARDLRMDGMNPQAAALLARTPQGGEGNDFQRNLMLYGPQVAMQLEQTGVAQKESAAQRALTERKIANDEKYNQGRLGIDKAKLEAAARSSQYEQFITAHNAAAANPELRPSLVEQGLLPDTGPSPFVEDFERAEIDEIVRSTGALSGRGEGGRANANIEAEKAIETYGKERGWPDRKIEAEKKRAIGWLRRLGDFSFGRSFSSMGPPLAAPSP